MSTVKRCFVPVCANNALNAPDKIFLTVPTDKNRRQLWCEAVGLPITQSHRLLCCEDHFKLDEDAENWMYFKTIGDRLRLKQHVVPHRNIKKYNPIEEQLTSSTKKRKLDMQKKLSEPPRYVVRILYKNIKTKPEMVNNEVGPDQVQHMKNENNFKTMEGYIKSEVDNIENDIPDIINLEDDAKLVNTKKDVEDSVVDCKPLNKDTYSDILLEKFDYRELDKKSVLEHPPIEIKRDPEDEIDCEWYSENQSENQSKNEEIVKVSGVPINEHNLQQHVERIDNSDGEWFKCSQCDFQRKCKKKLMTHVQYMHNPNLEMLQCPHCDYQTKSKKTLRAHVHHNHSPVGVIFRCSHCNYHTKRKTDLKRHTEWIHYPNPERFKCSQCDYQTKRKNNLQQHVKHIHDSNCELFKCSHCDFQTKWKKVLTTHVQYMHNSNFEMLQCPHCDYQTKGKINLKAHVQYTHNPDRKLFKCSQCHYQTKCKGNLKRHTQWVHNPNPEMFKCTYCDYQTKDKVTLRTHVQYSHNPNSLLFKCYHCDFQTKHKKSLRKHLQFLHNPIHEIIKCLQCDFKTNSKRYLRQHVHYSHNPHAKMFKCSLCDYETKRKGNLKLHTLSVHNPEPECVENKVEPGRDIIDSNKILDFTKAENTLIVTEGDKVLDFTKTENNLIVTEGDIKSEIEIIENDLPDIDFNDILDETKKEVVDCKLFNNDTYSESLPKKFDPELDINSILEHPPLTIKSDPDNQIDYEWHSENQSENEDTSPSTVFKCSQCGFKTKQKSKLKLHTQHVHNNEPEFIENKAGPGHDINSSNEILNFVKIENNSVVTESYIKTEVEITENNLPDIINLEFSKIKQDEEISVDDCETIKKDTYSNRLSERFDPDMDKKFILEEPPLIIKSEESSQCDYETNHVPFTHNLNLELLKCFPCDYQAKSKKAMQMHLSLHNSNVGVHNPEWFKCSQCDFQTKVKYYLKTHVKCLHNSNYKWFKCSQCDFQTKIEYYLKTHVKRIHNPNHKWVKCLHCDFKTQRESYLNRHIMEHFPDSKFNG